MNKYIALFVLSAYLLAFTQARQVLKLPVLVQHYITHKHQDSHTSIYSFIKMHYLDAPVKDADYQQDMKLPFKTFSFISVPVSTSPAVKVFNFSPGLHMSLSGLTSNFGYIEPVFDSHLPPVFRPPLLA